MFDDYDQISHRENICSFISRFTQLSLFCSQTGIAVLGPKKAHTQEHTNSLAPPGLKYEKVKLFTLRIISKNVYGR